MAAFPFYRLNFRARAVGGGVAPGSLWPPGHEALLLEQSHITFLIHGYNVTQSRGKRALRRLANALPWAQEDSAQVAVLWPGDSKAGALSFPFEVNDADDTVRLFVRYLVEDLALPASTKLSFVSHSMGARVVMGAVDALTARGYTVDQVCMMAAAIDRNSLANPGEYRRSVVASKRVSVLASKKDKVLRWAYPAGDFLETIFNFRDSPRLALGLRGPRHHRSHDVPENVFHKQIPKKRKAGHGHYIPEQNPSSAQRTQNQQSASHFANETLEGDPVPKYP